MQTRDEYCDYLLFGLLFRFHRPIPGLSSASGSGHRPDVEVQLGVSPHTKSEGFPTREALIFASPYTAESGEPLFQIWRDAGRAMLHLRYCDGMQFWFSEDHKQVWASWPESLSIEDAATYFLGPVLGILLRLRGVTCLHASAVAFGEHAVAFTGPAGAGKSTTAAALGRRGCGVLTDDIVALAETAGEFHVMPAYPHLSLWPESASMLYGSADALPRFSVNWNKCRLAGGMGGVRFEPGPRPLKAVYLLGERSAGGEVHVEAVSPAAGLVSLVPNTCANFVLTPEARANEFAVLGRLASAVPIRRLRARRDPACLDELCDVISRDFQSLSRSPFPENRGTRSVPVGRF